MLSKFFDQTFSKTSIILIGAGIGIATVITVVYLKEKIRNSPPKTWKKAGEISDILCYPIKSCGPIRVNQISCSTIGLQNGNMRDRIFMVIKLDGTFVTARQYPKLVQVQPSFDAKDDSKMALSAPGMIDISVDVNRLFHIEPVQAEVWSQSVKAIDCGEELAKWFSRFILSEDFGLRLVFYPLNYPTRDVREKNRLFETMIPSDAGALHDATSFMLLSEGSISDLNSRLDRPVTPLHFRPNFVVKGPSSFEEDNWKWVKIGDNVVFKCVKPCTRCTFTNVDPETGISDNDGQPLKTLKEYRKFPGLGESPVLGVHLGVRNMGSVSLGDTVYVGE